MYTQDSSNPLIPELARTVHDIFNARARSILDFLLLVPLLFGIYCSIIREKLHCIVYESVNRLQFFQVPRRAANKNCRKEVVVKVGTKLLNV